MDQINEALEVGVDIITLDNIVEVASSGVDYISVGALTHSCKVLDLSMKNLVNISKL